MEAVYEKFKKKYEDKVYKGSEAPPMQVLSSGVFSLDVATGVGGYPRGTLVEIFGRESVGKSALSYYAIAEEQKLGGYAAYVNLESDMTAQAEWMARIAGVDLDKLLIVNPDPGTEAVNMFGELIASDAFGVVVYDSIGAMSTDKELQIGESKQAYGQSALVTQMAKQALFHARQTKCIPMILNQVRDQQVGTYAVEKAPGGHGKDHLGTIRIHLKPGRDKLEGNYQGEKMQVMQRVAAKVVKNKVGVPRTTAGWNFWNVESPNGVIGIDIVQDAIDTAMRLGIIDRGGAMYKHDLFPEGKLRGKDEVAEFLHHHPDELEQIRQQLVMMAYNSEQTEMRETLTDGS